MPEGAMALIEKEDRYSPEDNQRMTPTLPDSMSSDGSATDTNA
jgi:hypothetical protein